MPTQQSVEGTASQTEETMYIVDRGASLHMTGKSPNEGGWRFSVGKFGGGFSVSVIAGKIMQRAWLLCLCMAGRRNSQIVHRKKKSLIVASKTSSPWRYQTKNGTIQRSLTSHGQCGV